MQERMVERANGDKRWYINGKLHREDGPAVESFNGDKYWYLNDKLHRTDGPALEYASGTRIWYLNGKKHREDGPAVEHADGTKSWCLNDLWIMDSDYAKKVKNKKFIEAEIASLKSYGIEVD
jgi:hypothetical protein